MITSPSSLCSAYDELNPALDFFALNAAAPGTGGDGESGGNSNSPPFVASAGDDRFPVSADSGGGRDRQSGKRPRGGGGNEDRGEEGGGGGGKRPQQPQPQPKRRPPTHFVAVRIDREEVCVCLGWC